MNSQTTRSFWEGFNVLPLAVQQGARRAYQLWRENPNLPGLRFKRVGNNVSVRIGRHYRALGILPANTVTWYWIGKHSKYDRILG